MDQLEAALLAAVDALNDEKRATTEVVAQNVLLALAGKQAVDAYNQQIQAVQQATVAHRQAAQAVREATAARKLEQAQQQALQTALARTQAAFWSAAGFFSGIAAKANPLAWEVLQDSLSLVVMELGRAFLPAIITAAAYAQQFAAYLATLSPATLQTAATIATVGAALYATTKVFSLVNVASFGLAAALTRAAVSATVSAVAANPLAAAITAAVGGLVALAFWSDRNANSARRGVAEVREGVLQSLGIADIEGSELGKKVQGAGTREEKQKVLQAEAGPIHDALVEAESAFRNAKDEDKEPARKQLEAAAKQAEIFDALNRQVTMGQTFIPHQGAGPGGFESAAGRQASEIGMLLSRFPKEAQPRFSPLEEARKQIQLNSLKTPLEQEQIRLQRQAAQDFIKLVPVLMKRLQEGKPIYGLG